MPLPSVLNGTAAQCERIRRNGERCTRLAMIGQTMCQSHGGASKVKKAAGLRKREVEVQEARMLTLVRQEAEIDPNLSVQEQYQRILGTIVAWMDVCQRHLEQLDSATFMTGAGDVKAHAIVTLWERSLDRGAKVLADAQHLKLDESRVRIEAAKKQRLADQWSAWSQALFTLLKKRLPEQASLLDQVFREDVDKITRDTLLGDQ